MLFARGLFDREILYARNVRHRIANLLAQFTQCVLIFAKDLDGNLGVDSGDQFIVAGLNYLREVELHAGKTFDATAHRIDQFIFGFGGGPLFLRLQPNIQFVVADALGVAAQFRTANLGDHGFDFRKFTQSLFYLRRNFDRARERDARRHRGAHQHVALVDGWQKLAAQNENVGDAPDEQEAGDRQRQHAMTDGPLKHGNINPLEEPDDRIRSHWAFLQTQPQRAEHRRDAQGH